MRGPVLLIRFYDILLPAGDEKTIDQGLLVVEDFAQGALLLPEELDRERMVVLAEMKNRDSRGLSNICIYFTV